MTGKCSKGLDPNIIEYLKTPPEKIRLKRLLELLGMRPRDLIRKRETETIKATGLDNQELDDAAVIEAMVANPILMERPIVVNGHKARLGRPAEKVAEIV